MNLGVPRSPPHLHSGIHGVELLSLSESGCLPLPARTWEQGNPSQCRANRSRVGACAAELARVPQGYGLEVLVLYCYQLHLISPRSAETNAKLKRCCA
jgi:hypothetical protein